MNVWIPILGLAIGWFTNWLALRMFFQWILPKKEAELKRGVMEGVCRFMPWYLQLPVVRELLERDVERVIERQNISDLGKVIYRAGKREVRLIELLGALIGGVVGLIAAVV